MGEDRGDGALGERGQVRATFVFFGQTLRHCGQECKALSLGKLVEHRDSRRTGSVLLLGHLNLVPQARYALAEQRPFRTA